MSNSHANTDSAVYPRSRGEHSFTSSPVVVASGLSPLARGTQLKIHFPVGRIRFIPARAGNTIDKDLPRCRTAVYPRSRGEHHRLNSNSQQVHGLSPLARGTLPWPASFPPTARFIPARAGNTASGTRACSPPAVYPRSRGEHLFACVRVPPDAGLSPLARGTPI